jgi:transposase
MKKCTEKQDIKVVGIDLGKKNFQLHAVDDRGHKQLAKRLTRKQLKVLMAKLPPCLVGLEACGGAHDWVRLWRSYGHEVRLIAPQFVKPYVKSNKNDRVDAEAICEAVQRPNMRFVAVKEVEQQDVQSLHRMRSLVVANRTAQVNQIRGLLLEYGIDIPKGRVHVRQQLPLILEDADNGLTMRFRTWLSALYDELIHLDDRVAELDRDIDQLAQADERARRLLTIPGIGPMGATALLAAIGDIRAFRNGRELAAWLGLVPRQRSTGGKDRLLGISKRGDVYLRQLLIHGARAVIRCVDRKDDPRSRWAQALIQRRNQNVAAVAMANKMVRTAYALLKHEQDYCVGERQVAQ